MSTRSRILLALLALTLAPLLGVAAWACVHAVRWSPESIQLLLARGAVRGALDVRTAREAATAALEDLATLLAAGGNVDSATVAAALSEWPARESFASLTVTSADAIRFHGPVAAPRSTPCTVATPPVVEAAAGTLRLRGSLAADALLSRRGSPPDAPRLVVVDAHGGGTIADPWCVEAAGLLPPGAVTMQSPDAFGVGVGDGGWAVVGVPGPAWPDPFPGPGLGLLAAAVFTALAAAGAFVILVRHLWRSMAILTRAADRIGGGDFSPWLPPPGHDEIGTLSFAIGTMAARLEQVMQQNARHRQMAAIGELASHVSHEIRNPLSSIKLNLQSIDREVRDGAVPADLPNVIRLCLREVNRLNGTVQGVLRLAGTGEPEFSDCAFHDVVRDALETVAPQLETRGTAVELHLDAAHDGVRADAVQLRGVVLNLLLNAHDAMGPERRGRIEIRSEVADDGARGPLLRVHFVDSGPGVPPEDRERIFQPFFTTKSTGTGIGLPLASRVVEAHGGRLYLERRSELETGAEFVVELPLSRAPAPAPQAAPGRFRSRRVPEAVA